MNTSSARPTGKSAFSRELDHLLRQCAGRSVSLATLLKVTEKRGYYLMLAVLTLPFLTPIPLPGLSTVFGLVVAFFGVRLILGKKPWLPRRLMAHKLPPRFLARILQAASRLVHWLEVVLRPRLAFLHERVFFQRLAGVIIALSGLLLLLPLPVPFSNFFPACTVFLFAVGAMESDGLFFLGGCFLSLATAAFFALLIFGGVHADKIFQAVVGIVGI